MTKKLYIPLLLWTFFLPSVQSQLDFGNGFGGTVGVSVALGTHHNRIGLSAKLYYAHPYFQVNLHAGGWYNAETIGSGKPAWEGQLKLGLVGCWGKNDSLPSPFINEVSNQNRRPFNFGYSYHWYFNNIGTSQFSASVGMRFYDFRFVIENDFLAFQSQDKYRTGGIGIFYRYRNLQFGLYHIAWTGDPYSDYKTRNRWIKGSDFPAKYGYIDMDGAPYADCSVGAVALMVEAYVPMVAQYWDAHIGIDADQIRNAVQNKTIHESFFLKNPHIPMVTADGKPYMYQPEQQVRRPLPFLQFGMNGTGWW